VEGKKGRGEKIGGKRREEREGEREGDEGRHECCCRLKSWVNQRCIDSCTHVMNVCVIYNPTFSAKK